MGTYRLSHTDVAAPDGRPHGTCTRCWDVNEATLSLIRTEPAPPVKQADVAYCWRDGIVETARAVPPGALEIARGCECCLANLLNCMAVPTHAGGFRIPGLLAAEDDAAAVALLRAELMRFTDKSGGCTLNLALDVRFIAEA